MKVLLVISDGFEDVETFTVASILRRAGVPLTTASLSASSVPSACGIKITADKRLAELDIEGYDALIVPSFERDENSQKLMSLVRLFNEENKIIVAMARSPLILAKAGVLENKIATIYPGMESKIPRPRDARVVIDGNIITSRTAGDSQELALKLIEIALGKAAAAKMRTHLSG